MKIRLHTWRYQQEVVLEFHGRQWLFDETNLILEILEPVFPDGTMGKFEMVTILSGEQFSVVVCDHTCELHGQTVGDGERMFRKSER